MEFNTLLFQVENGTATITINRPDKMNALNKDVIADLSAAMDEVYNNATIKSVIITGAGAKAFVAGADISEFVSLDTQGGAALAQLG
ncbi:MAG TPA: enoyl-CoA hydratase/isomerase family protein, partial [Chitinophagaceae bacterium]|nr:enoyl-CoA hydratase/isomerase family protein [Chitinophagaceae bacterium]